MSIPGSQDAPGLLSMVTTCLLEAGVAVVLLPTRVLPEPEECEVSSDAAKVGIGMRPPNIRETTQNAEGIDLGGTPKMNRGDCVTPSSEQRPSEGPPSFGNSKSGGFPTVT